MIPAFAIVAALLVAAALWYGWLTRARQPAGLVAPKLSPELAKLLARDAIAPTLRIPVVPRWTA